MAIFWVIFSYFLGSVPFGYLISRLSGKNVLQIGWRKTSGSNVFKNVGKFQGIATGLLDVAKGYLAVYAASALGLSSEVQILSGVAAVAGHNWSFFLKGSGGRGIGTFIGAFLAFSPQILFLSVIPLIVLALIWDAAIGTLLFLISAILISFHLDQFATVGVFTVLSMMPIFIKRLSPIKEITVAENKKNLIVSRLFFDDDRANWSLRIKRIIQRQKDNPSRAIRMVKPLAYPLVTTSKVSWKAAKFGVNMAKKPIKKWILRNHEKVVLELTTDDFKKMMVASAKKIVLHQEEINKINVFPVADKDTGYNLAATLLGVEGVVSLKIYQNFRELAQDIKEAAMVNARGNAGMIYTGYIIEVLDRIKHLKTIDAFHLALAMKRGIKGARNSISDPVEGTILDVIKTAGTKTFEYAKIKKEKNIVKVLTEAYKESLQSLKETKEKLPVLKENDVVDAGALGFVKIMEAWIESLRGAETTVIAGPEAIVQPRAEGKLEYRYEVVSTFKSSEKVNLQKIKEELSLLGNSLDILNLEDKVKFHIHTNQPEVVKEKFKNFPEFTSRVEDMEKTGSVGDEVCLLRSFPSSSPSPRAPRRALGLVVDEIADLPKDFLEKHDIVEVPFTTRFSNGEIVTSKKEIFQKMKEALESGLPLPTSSAPSFKDFLSAYQKAFERFEKILVITVSSKLSGTYSSARIARSFLKKPEKLNIYVFDCNNAEAGEGLAAIRAQELINSGKKMEEIVKELKKFCLKISLLICFSDFRYIISGGRLRAPKIFIKSASLIQKLGIRILVGLENGRLKFLRVNLGKDVAKILSGEIKKRSHGEKIRIAIAHADNPKVAEQLKEKLEKELGAEIVFVSSVSPVVAGHTGPGALLVAFHPIDN